MSSLKYIKVPYRVKQYKQILKTFVFHLGLVLKPKIRYVSNDLLTREQLISVQKEELVLPCSKPFSVEEADNVNVCYFMKD